MNTQILKEFSDNLEKQLGDMADQVQTNLGADTPRFYRYLKIKKLILKPAVVAMGLALVLLVLFSVLDNDRYTVWSLGLFFVAFLVAVITKLFIRNGVQHVESKIKSILHQYIFNTLGVSGTYIGRQSENDLHITKLFTAAPFVTKLKEIEVKDSASFVVSNTEVALADLEVEYFVPFGDSGSIEREIDGTIFFVQLPVKLSGQTYLSLSQDRHLLSRLSGVRLQNAGPLEEINLEWNDFEGKIDVLGTDPVEARYILTPDFMIDLYNWWKETHYRVEISFFESRMDIMFIDKHNTTLPPRNGVQIKSLNSDDLRNYTLSYAAPIVLVHTLLKDLPFK